MALATRLPASSKRLAAALMLVGMASTALAQDGDYTIEPWAGNYSAVRIRPGDQKIVAAGTLRSTNPDATIDNRIVIVRYTPPGTPDATFGIGGPSIPASGGLSAPALGTWIENGLGLELQPDGKALVAFGAKGAGLYDCNNGVARFTTGGVLDSSFSGGWSVLDGNAYDFYPLMCGVRLQSTGKIVLTIHSNSGSYPAIMARLKANGPLDAGSGGFGPSRAGFVWPAIGTTKSTYMKLAIQTDDRPVAAGSNTVFLSDTASQTRLLVARMTKDGTIDTAFGTSGYRLFLPAGLTGAGGNDVAVQPNGKIVVAGNCGVIGDAENMLVARFNANGSIDTSFGGGDGHVLLDLDGPESPTAERAWSVALQPDGKIVVAGDVRVPGGPSSVLVARLDAGGTPDASFGAGGYKLVAPQPGAGGTSFTGKAMALQADGTIVVAGWDSSTSGVSYPLLMRFDP